MPQILIENGGQIHSGLRVEIRDYVFGHNVLILKVLVEIVKKFPPAPVIVDEAAQRVDKSAPLKYMSWAAKCVDLNGRGFGGNLEPDRILTIIPLNWIGDPPQLLWTMFYKRLWRFDLFSKWHDELTSIVGC